MTDVLVDSNVILDIVTEDPRWFAWSAQTLANYAEQGNLVINPIIYAEVSIGFDQPEALETVLPVEFFRRDPLPYEAAFLAGRSFLEYVVEGVNGDRPSQTFILGLMPSLLHCLF